MLLALFSGSMPAHAGECWVATRASETSGTGESLAAPKFTRLVAATKQAEALLRADPALNAIGGVRFQANRLLTYIDNEQPTYTASVWVTLHEPDVWSGPDCSIRQGEADYFNKRAVEINFNQLTDITGAAAAEGEPDEPMIVNLLPEAIEAYQRTGVISTVGEGVRAFRPGGGPVLVPLTVSEYLGMWEKRLGVFIAEGGGEFATPQLNALKTHRSSLSPDQMKAQVWMDGSYSDQLWAYSAENTDNGAPIFQVAPELLKGFADKTAVNLVTVKWYGPDDDTATKALADWVRDFSPAKANALMNGGAK